MARSSSNASSGSSSLDNIDSDERGNDETACSPPPPIVDAQTKTTVCLLASKLMGLLVGQFEVDRVRFQFLFRGIIVLTD